MKLPPAPVASSPGVRSVMQGNRRRDTRPEILLRRELHRRGLRYRVDAAPLQGVRRRADVVFTRQKVAVFLDGCFWHRCGLHGVSPTTNSPYGTAKLDRNVERDRHTDSLLQAAGWRTVRVWEHDNPDEAADRICSLVRRD